jgi:hypothetical protein
MNGEKNGKNRNGQGPEEIKIQLEGEPQSKKSEEPEDGSKKSILKGMGSGKKSLSSGNASRKNSRVAFRSQIAEVIEVENWGEYNREPPKKGKGIGCCQLF